MSRIAQLTTGRYLSPPGLWLGLLLAAAFIVAAILTPTPDPFNQCLMALPMYIFYEVGIISAGFFNRKAAAEPATAVAPVSPKVMTPAMSGTADGEYLGVPTGAGRRR